MKKIILIGGLSLLVVGGTQVTSCKAMAKAAVKHWTKKQKKQFIAKCKEGAVSKFGDKANEVCSCVANIAEEKYPKAEDAMGMSVMEIVKLAIDCK